VSESKLCAYCKLPIQEYLPADLHLRCADLYWEALCREVRSWAPCAEAPPTTDPEPFL
jgi:hypothetical protein